MSTTHGMWAERHRPKTLDECVLEPLSSEQAAFLQRIAADTKLPPNLLFHGPPGTGKTTVARILCNTDDKYHVRQFNGSLIDKESVGKELSKAAHGGGLFHNGKTVILIDEVDGLTVGGQMALRALMEEDRFDTAWVMTCNLRKNLIDPIVSRLITVEFSYVRGAGRERHVNGIVRRCQRILESENVFDFPLPLLREVVERHYPDIRRTLGVLQAHYEHRSAA